MHEPGARRGPLLTGGQRRPLQLLGAGRSLTEVVGDLGMSVNAGYVQLKHLRDCPGLASNEEVVRKARELGYVQRREGP